jgi:hypothetical protein
MVVSHPIYGGLYAVFKDGPGYEASIPRQSRQIRRKVHYLSLSVGHLPKAQRQGRVNAVSQNFDVRPQGAGLSAAQRVNSAVLAAQSQQIQRLLNEQDEQKEISGEE